MRNIVIVSRGWYPYIKGGADRFIERLAYHLSLRKYKVVGITRLFNKKYINDEQPYDLYIIKLKLNFSLISSLEFSIKASKIVNRLKPSVVIINQYWAEASSLFINASIPKILIIHDIGFLNRKSRTKERIINKARFWILKKAVERAHKIVVPSLSVREDLVRYFKMNSNKIIVIGKEGVNGPLNFSHITNNYFDIVQIARFAPNKGHLVTLRAFKKIIHMIPNARLWLIGGAPTTREHKKYFNKILELVNNINKELGHEVVKVIVDAPDISKYLKLADICVASSIYDEGYGLAVAECMSYGKPVVASDIFRETGVVADERALIFRRGNPDELAEHVVKLYRDKELYKKLSRNALRYAQSISWENVVNVFEEIIEEIVRKER